MYPIGKKTSDCIKQFYSWTANPLSSFHPVNLLMRPLAHSLTDKSHLETPLEENVNRIVPEEGTVEARTIEDAIAVLRYFWSVYDE